MDSGGHNALTWLDTRIPGNRRRLTRVFEFDQDFYTYPTAYRLLIEIDLDAEDIAARDAWLETARHRIDTKFHQFVVQHFGDVSATESLSDLVACHGLFAARFANCELRQQVAMSLAYIDIPIADLNVLFVEAGSSFPRRSRGHKNAAVDFIVEHLIDVALLGLLQDHDFCRALESWNLDRRSPSACIVCGRQFRVIDLPEWLYAASGGLNRFCHQCQIVERPLKHELPSRVGAFVDACGFVPPGSASPLSHSFMSRVAPESKIECIKSWAAMGTTQRVKHAYGSWLAGLVATGVLADGVWPSGRGKRCIAPDGHECGSLEERQIDAWMLRNGIRHDREPFYPTHPTLNPHGLRRADWFVGGHYIEYLGLSGDHEYDRKAKEKLMLAYNTGIDLIVLFPRDLSRLDQALGARLAGDGADS